ncbi:unnamed protein product [Strongylus vulgaris]|uniref:Peptidase A1 domain-containing protein n=1 Tax=Strongylus vulgaris TaxID=40348 RepID=A0A3P7IR47_STRVU|nr:unnamed protein product [Strongylus vulgaris]
MHRVSNYTDPKRIKNGKAYSLQAKIIVKTISLQLEMIRKGTYAEYVKEANSQGFRMPLRTDGYEYGQIAAIGDPEQLAMLWIDTYTPLLWVPHIDCGV